MKKGKAFWGIVIVLAWLVVNWVLITQGLNLVSKSNSILNLFGVALLLIDIAGNIYCLYLVFMKLIYIGKKDK